MICARAALDAALPHRLAQLPNTVRGAIHTQMSREQHQVMPVGRRLTVDREKVQYERRNSICLAIVVPQFIHGSLNDGRRGSVKLPVRGPAVQQIPDCNVGRGLGRGPRPREWRGYIAVRVALSTRRMQEISSAARDPGQESMGSVAKLGQRWRLKGLRQGNWVN